jgi:hypothetical protein
MQRPARAFETSENQNDPIERLTEWQEHRYDPGYYTGGNIHPLFAASRPNKYGYFLIVVAIMTLIVLVLGIRAGAMDWYAVTVTTALILFLVVVGFKLIKKRPTHEERSGSKRRPSSLDN